MGRIYWYCWPCILLAFGVLLLHWVLQVFHSRRFRKQAAQVPVTEMPIFVIGLWRSGTSLLHELMTLDPRHAAPTSYECFCPLHFLVTGPIIQRLIAMQPKRGRPMDDMKIGPDSPQEDEFALFLKGVPSPYESLVFPNDPCPNPDILDVRKFHVDDLARWKAALLEFVQQVQSVHRRRLVLKSPTHTARIEVLAEMFPGARFLYIIRNPYDLFSSNRKLIRSLVPIFTLEKASLANVDATIFENYRLMHEQVEAARLLLPPGHFHQLRFEDLVKDPHGEMQKAYECLELGGFEAVRPGMEKYFAERADHKVGNYQLSAEERATVRQHWGHILYQHAYE